MDRRTAIKQMAGAAAAVGMGSLAGCGGGSSGGQMLAPLMSRGQLRDLLLTEQAKSPVPALAGAMFNASSMVYEAVGVRKVGTNDAVTRDDIFLAGSCQKSITATLAGLVVDKGKITFETTIAEVFPQFAAEMNSAFRSVTLAQILSNRGGFIELVSTDDDAAIGGFPYGRSQAERLRFCRAIWKLTPTSTPGTYKYSNAGFAVAGAMLEARTGQEFAVLMQNLLMGPLGGTYYLGFPHNFGPNPIGHIEVFDGLPPDAPTGILTASDIDPPDPDTYPIAPCGYRSDYRVPDFVRYCQMHLRGLQGGRTLLSPATFKRLHTPTTIIPDIPNGTDDFGFYEFPLNGVRTIFHGGNDGTFCALFWMQPSRGLGVVAMANSGYYIGPAALIAAATKMSGLPSLFPAPPATGRSQSGSARHGQSALRHLLR